MGEVIHDLSVAIAAQEDTSQSMVQLFIFAEQWEAKQLKPSTPVAPSIEPGPICVPSIQVQVPPFPSPYSALDPKATPARNVPYNSTDRGSINSSFDSVNSPLPAGDPTSSCITCFEHGRRCIPRACGPCRRRKRACSFVASQASSSGSTPSPAVGPLEGMRLQTCHRSY